MGNTGKDFRKKLHQMILSSAKLIGGKIDKSDRKQKKQTISLFDFFQSDFWLMPWCNDVHWTLYILVRPKNLFEIPVYDDEKPLFYNLIPVERMEDHGL